MRRLLIVFILSFTSFITELKAQQFSKGYLDSVKEFFRDWTENQKDFVFMVMDNATKQTDISMFCLQRIYRDSIFKSPCKFHKMSSLKSYMKREYGNESITLTENEIDDILERLKASNSFSWTKDVFPNAEIVDSTSYFKELQNRRRGNASPAYWTLSLPVFLRKGTFVILFSLYYCGSNCGYSELTVFKNESG